MDVLRYYFPVLCQLIGIGGIVVGGPWVGPASCSFPFSPWLTRCSATTCAKEDAEERRHHGHPGRALCTPRAGNPDGAGVESRARGTQHDRAPWHCREWRLASPGTSRSGSSRELLYHKRSPWKYLLGTYTQFPYMDCTRSVAHMMSHHNYVGTPQDSGYPAAPRACTPSLSERSPRTIGEIYKLERWRWLTWPLRVVLAGAIHQGDRRLLQLPGGALRGRWNRRAWCWLCLDANRPTVGGGVQLSAARRFDPRARRASREPARLQPPGHDHARRGA